MIFDDSCGGNRFPHFYTISGGAKAIHNIARIKIVCEGVALFVDSNTVNRPLINRAKALIVTVKCSHCTHQFVLRIGWFWANADTDD